MRLTRPLGGGIIHLEMSSMNTRYEHCQKSKHRTEEEKKHLITRLKTIEGQVRGISQMIESDRYCDDVLIQISAVTKSLKSLGNEILKSHLSTCVVEDIKDNQLEIIDEVMELIKRFNS